MSSKCLKEICVHRCWVELGLAIWWREPELLFEPCLEAALMVNEVVD